MLLLQNSSTAKCRRITNNSSGFGWIKNTQDRGTAQTRLQSFKSFLLLITPNKLLTFAGQQSQWTSNLTKTYSTAPIIVTQAQELLDMCNILRYRPLLNCIYLPTLQTNTMSINYMSQTVDLLQKQMAFAFLNEKLIFIK